MSLALEVAGVGMVTALGSSMRETIAALDRGERRHAATRLVDMRGDRIVGAFALPVHDALSGPARAELLAFPALAECADSLVSRAAGPAALFVCASLPWGTFGASLAPVLALVRGDWSVVVDVLAGELEARGVRVPASLRMVMARGHASGVLALEQAAGLFQRGEATEAWLVGVDTHGDRGTLERLDLVGALKSRRSSGGFVPGEAAGVLCVRPAGREPTGAVVRGIGLANETDCPSTARALTSAVARSLAAWGGEMRSVATVAIDLNGERARAREWSFAATRTVWREGAVPHLWHPADGLGDIGAATVPVLVGLLARRPGRSGAALAVSSSRDGLRGSVVVELHRSVAETLCADARRDAPVRRETRCEIGSR